MLNEQDRVKLDGIVQQMIANKESDENINFVVSDFKQKYSQKQQPIVKPQPQPEEPGMLRSFGKALVDPISKIGGSVAKTLLPESMEGSLRSGKVKSIFGGDVDLVGYKDGRELKGAEFAKDVAGTALEGLSYLPMAGVATKGVTMLGKALKTGRLAEGTLPKVLGLAGEGALAGGLVGTGSALQQNEDVGTALAEGATGAIFGGVTGPVIGHYAPKAVGVAKEEIPKLLTKEGRMEKAVAKREKEIFDIESNYVKTKNKNAYKADARAESRKRIANTDVLVDSVDPDGKINTKGIGGAIDQYKEATINGREGVVKDLLKQEGKLINIKDVEKYITETINKENKLQGSSLESAYSRLNSTLSGLARKADENGNIPLEVLHDAKIAETSNINYSLPSSKLEAKTVARGIKELIENTSNQEVKKINKELEKYYSDIELLEDLDGKRVRGGRLGKYFSQISGNIIGGTAGHAVGGPVGGAIGTIVGGEASSALKGLGMSKTFGKAIGKTAPESKILREAGEKAKQPRLALPAPKFGRDYVAPQSKSLGNLKTQYNNTKTTNSTDITPSIASKKELTGVDKEAMDEMNYYFDVNEGPQNVRYWNDQEKDYVTYRTPTSMADFPEHLRKRSIFDSVKKYWDKQERPTRGDNIMELYDELQKKFEQKKARIKERGEFKMGDSSHFAGAPAGITQDEEGNYTFDPKMAALGIAGMHVAGKMKGKNILREGEPKISSTDVQTFDKVARERFNIPELEKVSFGGSDRDVYDLGDGKVLKVTKTARGLDQQSQSQDWYAEDAGLIPKTYEVGDNYLVKEKVLPPNKETKALVKAFQELPYSNRDSKYYDVLNQLEEEFGNEGKGIFPVGELGNYQPLVGDLKAIRNWGSREDGTAVLLDEGTLNKRFMEDYNSKKTTNLQNPEFRAIYERSKTAKKKFGDLDKKTMYGVAGIAGMTALSSDKASALGFSDNKNEAELQKIMNATDTIYKKSEEIAPMIDKKFVKALITQESTGGSNDYHRKDDAGKYGWLVGFTKPTWEEINTKALTSQKWKNLKNSMPGFDTPENALTSALKYAEFLMRDHAKEQETGKREWKNINAEELYKLYNGGGSKEGVKTFRKIFNQL